MNMKSESFKKFNPLENVIKELNDLFDQLSINYNDSPDSPILMIVGCPRSGSTLTLQYLSNFDNFSYPSNLIARFYKNPAIGIKIQQALHDFDPNNQLKLSKNSIDNASSNLGRTYGALMPSEFWYFWREFFQFKESNKLSTSELRKVDIQSFFSKLYAFKALTQKDLVLKAMILNWNLPYLYKNNKNIIFINIEREDIYVAQSLLNSRSKYFGNIDSWYSFKPLEYKELIKRTPYEQVAGQVIYTKKEIRSGLEKIPTTNQITLSYSEFCNSPHKLIESIKLKYQELGFTLDIPKFDETIKFEESKKITLLEDEVLLINKFLNEHRNNPLSI